MAAKPSFELRLRVLNAVFDALGATMRERIKCIADKPFTDEDPFDQSKKVRAAS